MPLIDVAVALAESAVTWSDLAWIREHWRGPIVVKGVLTADDARRAVDEGAAAISVSNHGGRQLDCTPSSCASCPKSSRPSTAKLKSSWTAAFAAAPTSSRLSALARAPCFAVAPMLTVSPLPEKPGVNRAIEILRADLDRTLRLLGCPSVADLDRSYVNVPKSWDAN
jgi:isopentenyl diphosphate isomerase/L-lactate dehydrogenase-like FMN-dependent dehydrogenase